MNAHLVQNNKKMNLWEYIIGMIDKTQDIVIDIVFKGKDPKRFIQVKTSKINQESQIIAICSDITRIKQVEAEGQKMRSTFFSSVAHELRTPLNSIIPILRMILDLIPIGALEDRFMNYLKVVLNSSIHL